MEVRVKMGCTVVMDALTIVDRAVVYYVLFKY